MRKYCVALLCFASPVAGDTIVAYSQPNSVVVYLEGAEVTRNVILDLPAGRHTVVLPDLPPDVAYQLPRISVTNAVTGAVSVRSDVLPLLADEETPDIIAAREQLEASKSALAVHADIEEGFRAKAEAAETQIGFLRSLALNEGLNSDPENLRQVIALVGEQTERARQVILNAHKSIRELAPARAALEKDVATAQAALTALLTANEGRVQASVTLSSGKAVQAELTVSYFVSAEWEPTYDVSLATGAPDRLEVRRGAANSQKSGEDWTDVEIVLSTLSPGQGLAPSAIYPRKRLFTDPVPPVELQRRSDGAFAEPVVEAPLLIEEAAGAVYDGPGVAYVVPERVTIANSVDDTLISLDALSFEAQVFARGIPLRDDTAFLMARFQNTSNDPFLSTERTLVSVDGRFVGTQRMPDVPAGDEAVLAFGPIRELRLDRQVLDRTKGDSGFVSRSSRQEEDVRIFVRNPGSETYDLELLNRVPYNEQEDLRISYTAVPEPDEQNVEFGRGILMWRMEMTRGSEAVVSLSKTLSWPEGKVLR
ncbi:DUF4139 domain-containing protein [uncultured Roseobacter sp.]|uniref:DUF4139 domain-containing protein n=1 Tax=uncultured Roseobacter sp. TaxID=114847 RepID=UPI002616F004|nr:DUF4139 domain-containing protein [uncultured Roseobacter sp.]